VASESKPATHTEVVISAKPDVEGTELTDEAVVVPEEPYFNEGELTPFSPTPITHEPPALFATNESTPATPTEVVTSASRTRREQSSRSRQLWCPRNLISTKAN